MRLEAKNVSFHYGKEKIIENVDFSLEQGEIVGLAGPSGCGKTTFCKILAGYENPHSGTITINGLSIPKKGYNPVQLIHQHPEKVVNPRWKMSKILSEAGVPDTELLESLGIKDEWLTRWPNELSGGELQRFCVARALGVNTQFLLADEMTTMLDAITQAQIWHAVLEIAKRRNIGVLVVSHERKLVEKLCSRVIQFNTNK
ncbi:ABC transporter ATP-binding protein [Metabacillus fastidiosus]|uniref:ATP-binding cassette domain-containing protein n=1 Tax=Metabacillus fastidiosus TaxID=1458 RepID=A0ABU6P0W5_9BACI|nr:ATP-binding cassette domain-containing protein [Metabacillus fastidiosus]MED4402916.1 ATP-binding cassette domain-containing protein [Metabacillus fastidiosus]MED4454295.1 ATP-binding cassette domain-containing protein [Metabacillus fastidiosus]MED4461334.1 ATP-binding cassette domain-containing protein [Metabacillus fastidiosus]